MKMCWVYCRLLYQRKHSWDRLVIEELVQIRSQQLSKGKCCYMEPRRTKPMLIPDIGIMHNYQCCLKKEICAMIKKLKMIYHRSYTNRKSVDKFERTNRLGYLEYWHYSRKGCLPTRMLLQSAPLEPPQLLEWHRHLHKYMYLTNTFALIPK